MTLNRISDLSWGHISIFDNHPIEPDNYAMSSQYMLSAVIDVLAHGCRLGQPACALHLWLAHLPSSDCFQKQQLEAVGWFHLVLRLFWSSFAKRHRFRPASRTVHWLPNNAKHSIAKDTSASHRLQQSPVYTSWSFQQGGSVVTCTVTCLHQHWLLCILRQNLQPCLCIIYLVSSFSKRT